MPEDKKGERSIEMRLAELEDKLSKLHVTEEELKAYHKVSALYGAAEAPTEAVSAAAICQPCIVPRQRFINPCIQCIVVPPRRGLCLCPCNCVCECTCGPCNCGVGGSGGGFGGGFGGFGS